MSKKIWRVAASFLTPKGREIRKLKNATRYLPGKSSLIKPDVEFADAPSFVWQYLEIYVRGMYDFTSSPTAGYILDCGANVGVSVLYFAQKYPGAEIIAFEPDPDVYKILNRNVNSAHVTNVKTINAGVWNNNGQLQFVKEGADGGHLFNGNSDDPSILNVEVVRLRQYLNRTVDFLKIDIEGSELVVLEDCADLLKNVKNIFVEFHSSCKKEQQLDRILAIIQHAGFRYFIESATIHNSKPFLEHAIINEFDNLLNIYGYR